MNVHTLTAPAHWACYLINGEQGDLSEAELDSIITWLEREGMYDSVNQSGPIYPVSCESVGFCKWHDALQESPFATNCEEYTFLKETGQ